MLVRPNFWPMKNEKSPFMDERLDGFLSNLSCELPLLKAIYSVHHWKQKNSVQKLDGFACPLLYLPPGAELPDQKIWHAKFLNTYIP